MPDDEKDWGEYRREYNKGKYKRVYLYVSPEDKQRWKEEAANRNMGLSTFVKQCVDKELGGKTE